MSKRFAYIVAFIAIIYGIFIYLFNQSTNIKVDNYLNKYTQIKQNQYEVVVNSFQKLAINSFYGIINKKDITDIYKKTQDKKQDKNKIRTELYKKLKKDYRTLKMLGLKNLNFYLPNSSAFLRMANRKNFGDNVKDTRKSIKKVNDTKLPYEGFIIDNSFTGFSFIYPLFDQGKRYLGSVELSFAAAEIKNVFERSFDTSVDILLNKNYFEQSKEYLTSDESQKYLIKVSNQEIKYNKTTRLTKEQLLTLKSKSDRIINNRKNGSLNYIEDDISKIVSYIAIEHEILKDTIVYIVTYDDDLNIKAIYDEFNLIIAVSFILFWLIIYIVNKELRNSEILEKKVLEKTSEVRQLYAHEKYLKNLLQTITNINESLISSYSIESILDGSISKLKDDENYKLVTYSSIQDNKLFNRYKKGDKYNLIDKLAIDLNANNDTHILKGAIEAVKKDQTVINDNLNFEQYKHMANRAGDYILKGSISLVLKNDENENFGVLTLFSQNDKFHHEEITLLEGLAVDIAMAINATKQRNIIDKLHLKQVSNYEETILAFVSMIEQRDAYTAGHTVRVAKYCRLIAKNLKIEEVDISKLEKAAILHDIGKIATPDTILLKPGSLTQLEYNLIQNHVQAGYDMLNKVEIYKELADIIIYHHEKYDGTGYPNKVKGENIPLLAHILIVSDAFDAMTTNRIYKSRMNPEDAIQELLKCSGTHFHPEVVNAAKNVLKDISLDQTTQLPKTVLEEQRFSYFFSDSLTGVHNEEYLSLVLGTRDDNKCLYKLELKGMTQYNHNHGWEQGNKLLKDVAKYLENKYSTSMIFRYHGDDFLIMADQHIQFDKNDFERFVGIYGIEYSLSHYDMDEHNNLLDIAGLK